MERAQWQGVVTGHLALLAGAAMLWSMIVPNVTTAQDGAPPAAMEAPIATVVVRRMAETAEFIGYLQAVEHVEIRPRISGHIDSIHFTEGAIVEAGALLFQIDPRPYEIAAAQARADLAQTREQLALAEIQYERARTLVARNAVSRRSYDEAASRRRTLEAEARNRQAAVRAAELDLAYTQVTAPVAGRVGRALITKGNLVTRETGGASLLTTLVSVDPMHVLFDVDERVYLRALNTARGTATAPDGVSVSVQLMGEDGFPHRGRLDFIDNQVQSGTGTVRVRAVLPNPDGRLTPGLFARVRLDLSAPRETLLVAERAIGADQGRHFVLVLNGDNIVEYRPVILGPRIKGLRTVREGLAADDRVVVGALHRIRPGQAVAPVSVDVGVTGATPDDDVGG
ncbi:efflux RND transporter periplasmic adaptor subunit [Pelagibius sp.]